MRHLIRIGMILVITSIAFTASAFSKFEENDLQDINTLWELAMNSGNPETFARLYTVHTFAPPGLPVLINKTHSVRIVVMSPSNASPPQPKKNDIVLTQNGIRRNRDERS